MKNKNVIILFFLIFLLIASIIIGIACGAVAISPLEAAKTILKVISDQRGINPPLRTIIFDLRMPRVLLAGIVGAALAVVGVVMQSVFKNPLVDSYTIGTSAGAALGAVISIVFGLNFNLFGFSTIGFFAFLGALLTLMMVLGLARIKRNFATTTLLLAGVALSWFINAVISFLMMLNHDKIEQIFFWTMGSFAYASWKKVMVSYPLVLVGIIILLFYNKELDITSAGEESAFHLGIDTEKLKRKLLLIAVFIIAWSVSVSGTIGFLGLLVPHVFRMLTGSSTRLLIPFSALSGAILLILADLAARILIPPVEIPVGILTSLLGGPFFIFLLFNAKKGKYFN